MIYFNKKLSFNLPKREEGGFLLSGHFSPPTLDIYLGIPGYFSKELPSGYRWNESENSMEKKLSLKDGSYSFREELDFESKSGDKLGIYLRPEKVGSKAGLICDQLESYGSVFVHGGCVSRDTFELLGSPPLAEYRARSSVVSAMHDKSVGLSEEDLLQNSSPFQRRMVYTDVNKNLPALLAETTFDVFFIDLVVERTPIGLVGGVPVTISPEFKKCGLEKLLERFYDNTSEDYYKDFETCWKKLCKLVGEERVVVNRVFLASRYADGTPVIGKKDIDELNSKLFRLYHIIENISPNVHWITYDFNLFVADQNHKWGKAPYHYIKELHVSQLEQLQATIKSLTPPHEESKMVDARLSKKEILNLAGKLQIENQMQFKFPKPVSSLGIQLSAFLGGEASSKNMLISFKLTDRVGGRDPSDLEISDMHYSQIPDIGWYIYIPTHSGTVFWLRQITLPEGISCEAIQLRRWGSNPTEIIIKQLVVNI